MEEKKLILINMKFKLETARNKVIATSTIKKVNQFLFSQIFDEEKVDFENNSEITNIEDDSRFKTAGEINNKLYKEMHFLFFPQIFFKRRNNFY